MDTDSRTELQVDCDCLYFVLCTVGECLSTLERWEPQWRFLDRWVVKTGFCQRQFRQTNNTITENLSQAPWTGLYLDVHHDCPSREITLL
jgi:hypothetical protein